MKIAVVDDEKIFCLKIEKMIRKEYPLSNIYLFNDGQSYLDSSEQYDITILDIQMPKIDGIELSKQIKNKTKMIIFVTSLKERMQDAFGLNVYAFILKEELDIKLLSILRDAFKTLNNDLLKFSYKTEDFFIYIDDIYYIQIENRKLYLYTKEKEYQMNRQTLSEIYGRLNNNFAYVNQSCFVNLAHIRTRKIELVELDNGVCIPISKKYRKEFKLKYMRRFLND